MLREPKMASLVLALPWASKRLNFPLSLVSGYKRPFPSPILPSRLTFDPDSTAVPIFAPTSVSLRHYAIIHNDSHTQR